MKCACRDPRCTKYVAIDGATGTLVVGWDVNSDDQQITVSERLVHLDVAGAVTLMQQLRSYVLRQMEKAE